jgi:hypothetical protein
MKPAELPTRDGPTGERRGIDAMMHRYSRWKLKRLANMADEPLSTLALRNLYLSACVLLDGVFLPWVVVVAQGGFSFLLFAILLVPTLLGEGIVYRRLSAPHRERV